MRNELSSIESVELERVVGGAGNMTAFGGVDIKGKGKGGFEFTKKWNNYQACADDPKRTESISICQPLHNKGQ